MDNMITNLVTVVARVTPEGVAMLGTGFFVKAPNILVTARHVVGDDSNGLTILMPHIKTLNDYQDVSNTQVQYVPAEIVDVDPIRDICLIKFDGAAPLFPNLGMLDHVAVGDPVEVIGFPHCVEGRRVLTLQKTALGAKILLESNGIKSKHAVLNIQSRPGQSGSPVFSLNGNLVGMLLGTYAPSAGIMLGTINPAELNQTTQIISAEYIQGMLK